MLKSQKARQNNPEFDPMRLGTGWVPEDLEFTSDLNWKAPLAIAIQEARI